MAFNLTPKSKTAEATSSIHTDRLRQFLSAASAVVPKKSTIPILKCVAIQSTPESLRLCSTDSDCYVDYVQGGHHMGAIDLVVDYAQLCNIVEKAPKGIMTIDREASQISLKVGCISCGVLSGIPSTNFPKYACPDDDTTEFYNVPKFKMAYVHKYLLPLCTEDRDYTGISDILVETDGASYGFAATNRKMLISTNIGITPTSKRVIPSKAIRAITQADEDTRLILGDRGYRLESNGLRIYGRYIQGAYPDIHTVTPKTADHVHKVDVGALKSKLNLLMAKVRPTKGGMYPVMLSYSDDTLDACEVPHGYKFDCGGIKMDAVRVLKILERFDENSDVTFKSTCVLERPTVWEDSNGTSLLCCLR